VAAPARLALVFGAAVALFLPTVRYGWVQDDRPIIALNPAVRSIPAAWRALDQPYWPRPSKAGLYRPVTVLSYAVDWTLSSGSPGWFHFMNALWHGLVAVLVTLVLVRWLPPWGAVAAGLVFAVHPLHVEGVASLVSRAELLVAAAMLGAVLAARRRWWVAAVLCAVLAMFSKEHGVVTGALILVDDWLYSGDRPRYPKLFYAVLAVVTVGYLAVWASVGREATADVAPVFYGVSGQGRLAMALPTILRAAGLLVWPAHLSADYNPQVIAVRTGLSLAAVGGLVVVVGLPLLAWWCRRRAPAVTLAAAVAILAYLPTSNLFFPAGVLLAERNLYTPVLIVAAGVAVAIARLAARWSTRGAIVVAASLVTLLAGRSLARLPIWRDNKVFLLTTLMEHPESYRAHQWAAAVLAGVRDTTGARREYTTADSLFPNDPHLEAARAFYLVGLGDTTSVAELIARTRRRAPLEPIGLRAEYLLWIRRGNPARARALADSAVRAAPGDSLWYRDRARQLREGNAP
jgi:protein O-mannosyl-transferase